MKSFVMLTELANNLSESKIRYCVLHGWQSLPQSLSSDLDMVVHHADLRTLERILRNQSEGRLIQLLQHESSCFYFVLAIRQDSEIHFILVDVATDYRRDRRVFFTGEELLAGRRQRKNFWVASPRVEYQYLLIKKVAKGAVPEHQKNRLQELCEQLGNEARSSACYLFGKQYGNFMTSCITTANWNALESKLSRIRKALLWQVLTRDPFNPFRYLLSEVRRVWNRCRFPTGLVVAVLGPDGAGKTTLIHDLRENLTGAFRRTEAYHLRPMVMGQKGTQIPVTDPHGKAPHPWWLSLLKIPYYLLDYGLGYLFKVRPRLVRSTLVLFDRYYDDVLVDPRRYRYGGPHWFARLARHFVPRPHLILVVDVPEKELLARKQEVSHTELGRQRDAYRKLATELPNAVLLDGSLSPKEVALNASEAILDYLQLRYLNRRHLWFRDNGSEALNWLESVLFPSQKSRLALSNPPEDSHETQWQTNGSFGWLALNDGRGYLIPLSSSKAAISGLHLYNVQKLKARVAKKLLAICLNKRFGRFLLPKVRTLVRRDVSKNERTKVSLLEHLKEVLARTDMTFAISFGTPGPHRKPVIELLNDKGEVLGFVKVGWNEATNTLVRNEADISRYLSGISLNSFTAPTMLYAGWWNDHFLCIQSAPAGRLETAPQNLTSHYVSILEELKSLQIRWMPLKESAFWKRLLQRVEMIQNTFHRHILQRGLCRVDEALCDKALPFYFCHGDFAPWNVQLLNGCMFLFDWEYADLEAPPLWDLFHFNVQTLRLLEERSAGEIYKAILNDGVQNGPTRMYLESLNMKQLHLRSFFLIYILDRLASYASDNDADPATLRCLTNISSLIISDEQSSQ
jgi:thymidylate kinase